MIEVTQDIFLPDNKITQDILLPDNKITQDITYGGIVSSVYPFGKCLQLAGINTDYIQLSENIILSGDFTISYWALQSAAWNDVTIVKIGSADNFHRFNVNGTVLNRIGGSSYNFNTGVLPTNEWVHFMFTRDSTTARVYINGEESTTGGVTVNTSDVEYGVFGIYHTLTQNQWNGKLDDFFFKQGLAGDVNDALAIYNGGDGRHPQAVIGEGDHFFQFNEGEGTILGDSEGGINGTINGCTWVDH